MATTSEQPGQPEQPQMPEITPETIALFKRMAAAPLLEMGINPLVAFYIVTTLQLALRHPNMPDVVGSNAEAFARGLQQHLGRMVDPRVAELLELGWNRELDGPPGGEH